MTFKGAPATAAILLTLIALEVAIFVGGRLLGIADWSLSMMARNQLRDIVLGLFGFMTLDVLLPLQGAAPIERLGTLITHALLHGGLVHLAFNGAAFATIGPPVERSMGPGRFALLYALAAVGGALGHVGYVFFIGFVMPEWLVFQLQTQLVGASGAICGVLGADFRLRAAMLRAAPPERRRVSPGRYLWSASFSFVMINLLIIAAFPTISGAAHIGGFLVGLAIAPLLAKRHVG